MATQRAALTLLAALAALLPGCACEGLVLPRLPADGVCCEVTKVVPQSLLRRGAKDFARAQHLCTGEKTSWQYTIFAGFDSPAGGGDGAAVFGCASATEPACVRRDPSVCQAACLRTQTCFLRFPTATPFLVEQEEARNTRTRTNAVVQTTRTGKRSDVNKRNNGETVHTNVTEVKRGRVNISSTEKKKRKFLGVNINSRNLPILGDTLLRSPQSGLSLREKPAIRLGLLGRPSLDVFSEGAVAPDRAGKSYCCRLSAGPPPEPLVGITGLLACQTRCRSRQLGLAVRISASQWGCGGDGFKNKCGELASCGGCLEDSACMTVYRISLIINIESVRNRTAESTISVSRAGRNNRRFNTIRQSGVGNSLTSLRTLDDFTREDISGSRQSREVTRENRRSTSNIGLPGGDVQGGVVVEASVTVTGTAATNRNITQRTTDSGRTNLKRNLTQPGTQVGSSVQVATRDVTQNRNTALKANETSKEVTRTSSASGNQRGELLPGLLTPKGGAASLSASERNNSELAQDNVVTATAERTTERTNLRTADGSRQRSVQIAAVLRTDAERTGARNDSTIRTTGFTTENRQLGTVRLDRQEQNSGSVVDRVSASDIRTGSSARTVTACGRCNRTTDLTAQSRGDRKNHTTAHIETVKRDVTKTTNVTPGHPLPSLTVTARDTREAQTADSNSRGIGTTSNITSLRIRGTGYRSSRNRTVLSVERNNSTDHIEEVKKVTVIRAVTS